jgi:GNAT superfamily N-acetyltransferase
VHPAYRGRGLGTAIAAWIRDTARERGETVVGMPVPQGSAGDRLLAALGYHVRWESWVLELPRGRQIDAQPLPEGYSLRTALSEQERRAVHDVVEDAFLEWSQRDRSSYEDFEARTVRRPGFEPWQLRTVVDSDGATVGACLTQMASEFGYVAQLAVRRDKRGLGLARALLVDAFANAREHGAVRFELSTDSRTGALGLYHRVGMEVTHTWVNRAIALQ